MRGSAGHGRLNSARSEINSYGRKASKGYIILSSGGSAGHTQLNSDRPGINNYGGKSSEVYIVLSSEPDGLSNDEYEHDNYGSSNSRGNGGGFERSHIAQPGTFFTGGSTENLREHDHTNSGSPVNISKYERKSSEGYVILSNKGSGNSFKGSVIKELSSDLESRSMGMLSDYADYYELSSRGIKSIKGIPNSGFGSLSSGGLGGANHARFSDGASASAKDVHGLISFINGLLGISLVFGGGHGVLTDPGKEVRVRIVTLLPMHTVVSVVNAYRDVIVCRSMYEGSISKLFLEIRFRKQLGPYTCH